MNGTIAGIDDTPAALGTHFPHGGAGVWHLVSGTDRVRRTVKPIGRSYRSNLYGLKQSVVTGISTHVGRIPIIVFLCRAGIPNVSLQILLVVDIKLRKTKGGIQFSR